MISTPPINGPLVDENGRATQAMAAWLNFLWLAANSVTESGTTAQRPSTHLWVGRPFFDTTLDNPVFWNGTDWVYWPDLAAASADASSSTVSVTSANASAVTGTATGTGTGFLDATEFNNAITAIGTIRTLANELKGDVNSLVTDVNAVVTSLNDLKAKLRTAGVLAE